jgi:hypothetical protein
MREPAAESDREVKRGPVVAGGAGPLTPTLSHAGEREN